MTSIHVKSEPKDADLSAVASPSQSEKSDTNIKSSKAKGTAPVFATTSQLAALNALFARAESLNKQEVDAICEETGLTSKWVKSWFQRKRRQNKMRQIQAVKDEATSDAVITGQPVLDSGQNQGAPQVSSERAADEDTSIATQEASALPTTTTQEASEPFNPFRSPPLPPRRYAPYKLEPKSVVHSASSSPSRQLSCQTQQRQMSPIISVPAPSLSADTAPPPPGTITHPSLHRYPDDFLSPVSPTPNSHVSRLPPGYTDYNNYASLLSSVSVLSDPKNHLHFHRNPGFTQYSYPQTTYPQYQHPYHTEDPPKLPFETIFADYAELRAPQAISPWHTSFTYEAANLDLDAGYMPANHASHPQQHLDSNKKIYDETGHIMQPDYSHNSLASNTSPPRTRALSPVQINPTYHDSAAFQPHYPETFSLSNSSRLNALFPHQFPSSPISAAYIPPEFDNSFFDSLAAEEDTFSAAVMLVAMSKAGLVWDR